MAGNLHQSSCFYPAYSVVGAPICRRPPKAGHFQPVRVIEPAGIEPATSCFKVSIGVYHCAPQCVKASVSGRCTNEHASPLAAVCRKRFPPALTLGRRDASTVYARACIVVKDISRSATRSQGGCSRSRLFAFSENAPRSRVRKQLVPGPSFVATKAITTHRTDEEQKAVVGRDLASHSSGVGAPLLSASRSFAASPEPPRKFCLFVIADAGAYGDRRRSAMAEIRALHKSPGDCMIAGGSTVAYAEPDVARTGRR